MDDRRAISGKLAYLVSFLSLGTRLGAIPQPKCTSGRYHPLAHSALQQCRSEVSKLVEETREFSG